MFTPQMIRKIEKANLVGRGCNNFPTAKKWQIVRNAKTKANKYVICNVSESEPGVFKDRYILENWPERVVDGIKIGMKTIGAQKGFIYLNPEYYQQFEDYLKPIIESENVNIELYQKPLSDYVGGEETALINSMQGKRIEPKLKPPFPTTNGFDGDPTLINNCETFYAVSLINSNEYKNNRFYCLSEFAGRIFDGSSMETSRQDISMAKIKYVNQQIKELLIDISIKKALQEFDHQPSKKYFYQIGGGAGGTCLNYKQLNRPFKCLASIVIYRVDRHEKDIIMNWLSFFKNESCGQCVPCREGTYRLRNIMKTYYQDNYSFQQKAEQFLAENREVFNDLVFSLQNTSLCPVGKVSVNAMLTYWKNVKKLKITAQK